MTRHKRKTVRPADEADITTNRRRPTEEAVEKIKQRALNGASEEPDAGEETAGSGTAVALPETGDRKREEFSDEEVQQFFLDGLASLEPTRFPSASAKFQSEEAIWANTRHGGGRGMIGVDQAILYATAFLYRNRPGLTDDQIVERVLNGVRQIHAAQCPRERWDWREERREIADKLQRYKKRLADQNAAKGIPSGPIEEARAKLQREARGGAEEAKTKEEAKTEDAPAKLTALEYGVAVLNSKAKWDDETKRTLFEKMSQEHAVVSIGGTVRYLHQVTGADGRQSELRFLKQQDMQTLYEAIQIPVEKTTTTGGSTTTKTEYISAFNLWRRSPERRQYVGAGMFPGKMPVPKGYLNLWTGFAVEPREGDWSKFREHIRKVICGEDAATYAWVMDWLAHSVQRPDEKPGSALVLKGHLKGTGKTILNIMMKGIHGVHASSVSKSEQLVGRFNGHLLRNVVLGVEEAFWAGDKAATGALKNLITERRLAIELKGIDVFDADNFTRLIFTSNEDWAVPVGVDERRFMVLEVQNKSAKDPRYFDPIFKQMLEQGGLEAMLYELMNRKIVSNLRNPPETTALVHQRKHSLDALPRWIWAVAREGELSNPEAADLTDHFRDGRVIVLSMTEPTQVSTGVVQGAAKKACPGYKGGTVDTDLGKLLTRLGVRRRQVGKTRRPVYEFPPLPELREAVERELRVDCQPEPE